MKILKKAVAFVMVTALCLAAIDLPCLAKEEEKSMGSLYSLSCAMIDGSSGRVLYEKNGYEERAMASTTKIMTLILALEYSNMDELVTVSSYAAKMPDVQLGIREGEQYKLEDLIYSMMLESHNDSAVAIAEHVGVSVEKFADMMNKKACEIGLSSTYFITANGLDASNKGGKHSTTAVELALIMKYCVMESPQKDMFIKVCQTRDYSFSDYEGKRSFSVHNHNRFLDMMDGVIAGKTGFTADAGYCYVAAVEKDGKTYIISLLGCGWPNNKNYKWHDAKTLLTYGFDNYKFKTILDENWCTECIPVSQGIEKDEITLYINENISMLLSDEDKIEIRPKLPSCVAAPVKKGDIIGSLDIYINDEHYKSINVYSADRISRVTLGYYFRVVASDFLL